MNHLFLSKNDSNNRSIQYLETKVARLKAILALAPFKNVNFFYYGSNGSFVGIDQSMFAIDISNEMKLLLEESIEIFENDINQLKDSL